MGQLDVIRTQLGLGAIRAAQADSEAAAFIIDRRKEDREQLRDDVKQGKDEVDQIRDEILEVQREEEEKDTPSFFQNPFKAVAGLVKGIFDGANPTKHEKTEELSLDAKEVQATIERDETKLEILASEQRDEFGRVNESYDSMKEELDALGEIASGLGKVGTLA